MFSDDNKEVRQNANKAGVIYITGKGDDSLNSFLPLFKKAIEDDKWRVRYEAYEAVF